MPRRKSTSKKNSDGNGASKSKNEAKNKGTKGRPNGGQYTWGAQDSEVASRVYRLTEEGTYQMVTVGKPTFQLTKDEWFPMLVQNMGPLKTQGDKRSVVHGMSERLYLCMPNRHPNLRLEKKDKKRWEEKQGSMFRMAARNLRALFGPNVIPYGPRKSPEDSDVLEYQGKTYDNTKEQMSSLRSQWYDLIGSFCADLLNNPIKLSSPPRLTYATLYYKEGEEFPQFNYSHELKEDDELVPFSRWMGASGGNDDDGGDEDWDDGDDDSDWDDGGETDDIDSDDDDADDFGGDWDEDEDNDEDDEIGLGDDDDDDDDDGIEDAEIEDDLPMPTKRVARKAKTRATKTKTTKTRASRRA